MANRVTIQDIADALNISRNTVSKAINNTGVLADATREKVLKKAIEMGYKQFSYINLEKTPGMPVSVDVARLTSAQPGGRNIALLTTRFLNTSHFSSTMLDRVQRDLSQQGYSMSVHRINEDELASCSLPASLRREEISGIMCIELFDLPYSDFLCTLDIPILFIDGPVPPFGKKISTDVLLMNNSTEIFSFVSEMKNRGKTKLGFVGMPEHCLSFCERFRAFQEAVTFNELPFIKEYCFTRSGENHKELSPEDFRAYLKAAFQGLASMPEVLLCANDFLAIDVIKVLRELNVRVPEDIWICGFDNSPESTVVTPNLTTIHIHSQVMGYSAVSLLLSRIENPSMHYRRMYTETTLIYRESTGD